MPGSTAAIGACGCKTSRAPEQPSPWPADWQAVESSWLAAQVSPHTRRHYRTSWRAFSEFMGTDCDPRCITSDDANAWIASLRARGQSASTIISRVAACASLYDFIARHAP